MLRSVDALSEQFLAALSRIENRAAYAQQQVASGRRVSRVSDAPGDVGRILGFESDIARTSQLKTGLGRLLGEVQTAGSTLQAAVRVIEQAIVLGAQGAGNIDPVERREILAPQVLQLLEHMVGLSRLSFEGRFVFSGDDDQSPAYDVNLANPNGVNRLLTAPATRQIQDSSGLRFATARTAGEIFDHRNPDDSLATNNAFAALNTLRLGLETNDQVLIDAALIGLRATGDYLNQQAAYYGGLENRIAAAIDIASKFEVQWQADLSAIRDADLPAVVLELTEARTHQETVFSAAASRPRTSLFDFLR